MALVAVKGLLDQSVARGVGKSAKGRWCEYKTHTFMSSASLVLVRLASMIRTEFYWLSQIKFGRTYSTMFNVNVTLVTALTHPGRYTQFILFLLHMLRATISLWWGLERIRAALQGT